MFLKGFKQDKSKFIKYRNKSKRLLTIRIISFISGTTAIPEDL